MPKRERKKLIKRKTHDLKEIALQEKVRELKLHSKIPERKIASRLRRSLYWVQKALGKNRNKFKHKPSD
jgi:hypothetical protein